MIVDAFYIYNYHVYHSRNPNNYNKKAQLSLTNPRDACEKFARFTYEQWGCKLYS